MLWVLRLLMLREPRRAAIGENRPVVRDSSVDARGGPIFGPRFLSWGAPAGLGEDPVARAGGPAVGVLGR